MWGIFRIEILVKVSILNVSAKRTKYYFKKDAQNEVVTI